MKNHVEILTDLKNEFERIGIEFLPTDEQQLLTQGADTYLTKRGKDVPQERMDGIYLILQELRETLTDFQAFESARDQKQP